MDGRIGTRNLEIFIGANALLFIVVTYFINHLAFVLSIPTLIILAGYSIFKRFSSYAHLSMAL